MSPCCYSGGIALAVLIGQAVVAQAPWIGDYTPGRLTSWGKSDDNHCLSLPLTPGVTAQRALG